MRHNTYRILDAQTRTELQNKVNLFLSQGYSLVGGVSAVAPLGNGRIDYCQAVAIEEQLSFAVNNNTKVYGVYVPEQPVSQQHKHDNLVTVEVEKPTNHEESSIWG